MEGKQGNGMRVFQLHPSQKMSAKVEHELFDYIPDGRNFKQLFETDKGTVFLGYIRWIVGRYLKYFPQTERFLDDMVSEAALAMCECIALDLSYNETKRKIDKKVRYKIEKFLNDNRSLVRSSLSTNKRAQKIHSPLNYSIDFQIRETDNV